MKNITKTKFSTPLLIAIFATIIFLFPVSSFASVGDGCGQAGDGGSTAGVCMNQSDANSAVNCVASLGGGMIIGSCGNNEVCCKNMNVSKNTNENKGNSSGTGNTQGNTGNTGAGNNTGTGTGNNPGSGTGMGNTSSSNPAGASSSGGIVPCGNGNDACTLCHLIKGIYNLVKWGRNILIIAAIVGIVASGILYMISSGDQGMMTTAKSFMMACITGFAITVAAWLIVDITLQILTTKKDLGVGASAGWNSFSCSEASSALTGGGGTPSGTSSAQQQQNQQECAQYCNGKPDGENTDIAACNSKCMAAKAAQQSTGGTGTGGTGTGGNGGGNTATGTLSDSSAKQQLSSGIKVTSSGGCSDQNNPSCTSLEGIPASTIQNLNNLQSGYGQSITITGGTEVGHKSHGSGNPNIDLSPSPGLYEYIQSHKSELHVSQMIHEGNHLHVVFGG